MHTGELFETAYAGNYHLTLQTCIENNGDVSWGRLFIIARPMLDVATQPPVETRIPR
jgi:hypothetical protein